MRLSWQARTYIAAVVLTTAGVGVWCFSAGAPVKAGHVLLLASLFLLAEWFPVNTPRGGAYSVSFVVGLAAIVTQGPAGAFLVAVAGGLNLRGIRRHPAPVASRVFNGSNFALCTGLAALGYQATGGPIGEALLDSPVRNTLLPVIAATGVNFALNTTVVAMMLSLATPRRRFRAGPMVIWRTEFANLLPGYFAFALLGLLMGMLYLQVHASSIAFILIPLLIARSALQTAVRLQSSYESTVSSLVTAIGKKDVYTRDHARRVSRLTEMVAAEYGIRGDRLRSIKLAALLHDVGKLGVPTAVLAKPGKLTPDEYSTMKNHPIRGQEIVQEIDMLREALVAVRHHHERIDGRGYPDGLKGEEVPPAARIIMVCDAFDSMTSTRAYRESRSNDLALAELRRCAGTQFDPAAIDALERALNRHGWIAEPEIGVVRRPVAATSLEDIDASTS